MRVVATAGHVDHGKSTLVLALTGTDPDRFPEEKARGLTIDLGFAFTTLPVGSARSGSSTCPVTSASSRTCSRASGAVDVALLVVAANEGWMPQSEEHLRILELLGVRHGLVALTKADLVDADTLELARLEVDERLATPSLARRAGRRVRRGRRGAGSTTCARALDARARRRRRRPRTAAGRGCGSTACSRPRGAGTVVTGTLAGGAVAVDDALEVVRLDRAGAGPRHRERAPARRARSSPARASR